MLKSLHQHLFISTLDSIYGSQTLRNAEGMKRVADGVVQPPIPFRGFSCSP